MLTVPRIAIIGAGPAGLTLARLLHISPSQINITVFESDASATSRSEADGTLDLHATTGLAAVRACGLWDKFVALARFDGDEIKMVDKERYGACAETII